MFWASLEVNGKRGLIGSLARICAAQNSGDRMTIYDAQSGKQLAYYNGMRITFD